MKVALYTITHLLIITACLFFTAERTHAQWSTNPAINNAICTATGNQSGPTIVSDDSGGAIITWNDYRSGTNYDIYAQKINASGVVQWSADGVALCTAAGNQQSPTIVSDGSGGAIITWQDIRSGANYDIYAQKINASGAVQWSVDGVALCTATFAQSYPTIVSDGSGGAIITWYDRRSGTHNDIYAQRINASGAVQWSADGVALCTATGDQNSPTIVSDGSGGAIITWYDYRGTSNDIYAQKINTSGAVQWSANGVALCTAANEQSYPAIVSDGSGGAIITWQDYRSTTNYDIYAQRINSSGAVQWTADGVALCTTTGDQYSQCIISDGSGGAIITWRDYRSGTNFDIYAQKINVSGVVQWTADGAALCTATGSQYYPIIASDGYGGAIITWYDGRGGTNNDIYAQKINASGTVQWTSNGVALCTAMGTQTYSTIVSDGSGGAIITWNDYRSGIIDIYAQRVDKYGVIGIAAPKLVAAKDIANDQGGRMRIFWDPSYLDADTAQNVKSYTLKLGAKTTGVMGKSSQSTGTGIYWQTVGIVRADQSVGYSSVVSTYADSGLQGIPEYYFQVIAKNNDSTQSWLSNIDSGYSVDNIPPVGIAGAMISSNTSGNMMIQWNKNRVDRDLMGYVIYKSNTGGFPLNETTKLAQVTDTMYIDATTSQGNTYYYRVAGIDVHGNVGTPSNELVETALALELSAFTATQSHRSVILQWKMASETNNRGFDVEKRRIQNTEVSTQNIAEVWGRVGFVEGSGTSNVPREYSFTDTKLDVGKYSYRLKQTDNNGSVRYSSEVEAEIIAPKVFELSQNYPNPFNPTTTIEFTLPENGRAVLKVFNSLGQEVATLFNGVAEAGQYHQVIFSAEGGDASRLSSGIYIARLDWNGNHVIKKMMLLK
ncbi:MAG: T9SS type A sorting domain-containing protein [Bacteroidota bacterium]|nr:T9SS type A sorting domain-containing protein [Bacteroidota bacterium]